jgi:exopolysaccharide biosynthesis polyprenyl glycosylphosphotransferase
MRRVERLPGRAASTTDLPILAIVPLLDVAALLGAAAFHPGLGQTGLIFVGVGLALLSSPRTRPTRLAPSVGEDLPAITGRVAVATLALAPLAAARSELEPFMWMALAALGLATAGRLASYRLIRLARSRGVGLEATLIVGAGQVGVLIADALRLHPEYGLNPVGFIDSSDVRELPFPIVGPVADIPRLVALHSATRIIVAFGPTSDQELAQLLRACDRLPVEIYVVPRFFDLGIAVELGTDEIAGIPVMKLHRAIHRSGSWPFKRALDIVVATAGLIVSLPFFALAALLVRISSPGPILFRQRRLGEGEKSIEILKFRTMRVNEDSDTTWSVAQDDRLTRIGRLLRQTHLDELPQLINILRGDMSLVGPRPERPYFAELFGAEIASYSDRHRVPVGLTGWAQVNGLYGDTSIEERIRFDNRYIERWSVWRDLVILARTGFAVVKGFRSDTRPNQRAASAAKNVVDIRDATLDLRLVERVVLDPKDQTATENGNGSGNGNGHHAGSQPTKGFASGPGNGHKRSPRPDRTDQP